MKSLKKLLLFLPASLLIFTACEDDDDPDPEEPNITTFTVNGESNVEEGNHNPLEEISFLFEGTTPEGGDELTIEIEGHEDTTFDISGSSFSEEFDFTVPEDAEEGDALGLTFIASDQDGDTDDLEAEYSINVNRTLQDVTAHDQVTLGAQNNENHDQYIGLHSGDTWAVGEADASGVDAAYFDDPERVHTFAAPFTEAAQETYEEIEDWATQNETSFKHTSVDVEDFNAIEDHDFEIHKAWADEQRSERDYLRNVSEDAIFAFQTEEGHEGLFRVRNIEEGNQGRITIDIKVQE